MKPNDFDELSRSFAAGTSRRRLLRFGVGSLATLKLSAISARTLARQPDATPEATVSSRPIFEPLFPPLEPIPTGPNEFVIDGQEIVIDEALAADLAVQPVAPVEIQGETVYISIDPELLQFGTPIAGDATPEASPVAPPQEGPCLGADDSQDVEAYDRGGNLGVSVEFVRAFESTTGNLRWKSDLIKRFQNPGTVNNRRWCSGALVAEDLWLTAAHCFNQRPSGGQRVPTIDGTDSPISRPDIALNMQVDFRYQLDEQFVLRPFESIDVVELVEDRLGGLDYAIVRLASPPTRDFSVAKLSASDTPLGNTISIIGHPRGEPKRVAAGTASEYVNDRIYYNDLDTDYGSSGAAILSSPDGSIVGVHTTGGCDMERSGQNSGFRISALLRVSPTLRALAQA